MFGEKLLLVMSVPRPVSVDACGEANVNLLVTLQQTLGTAVAQWLRCCATNQTVAGSIPAGVSGFFVDI